MTTVRFSPRRICVIAQNTMLEAVRQRLFAFLALVSIAVVVSALFFRDFNFGSSELKFISDFGLGALTLFGSVLAIVTTAQLFFSEIENRTVLTVLAKPVFRSEFVLGKFLGVLLILLVFVVLVATALVSVLFWRERQLMESNPAAFAHGSLVAYGGLVVVAALQWLKFALTAALTLLVASYANTNLFTVAVSFLILVICHLQHLAHDAWSHASTSVAKMAARVLALLFPNFQLFNLGEEIASGGSVSGELALRVASYAAIYILVVLALAIFSFRQREI